MPQLKDICHTIRSKQAGPFRLTFDIVFKDEATYRRVRDGGSISRALIAKLYRRPLEDITHVVFYEPGRAVKITMIRPKVAGDPGDGDIYGCQQHVPLLDAEVILA
jgi:hypothetical protein